MKTIYIVAKRADDKNPKSESYSKKFAELYCAELNKTARGEQYKVFERK